MLQNSSFSLIPQTSPIPNYLIPNASFFYHRVTEPASDTYLPKHQFSESEKDLAIQIVLAGKKQDDDSIYKYGKKLLKLTKGEPKDALSNYALSLYYTHPDVNLSDERKFKKIVKYMEQASKLDPRNEVYRQNLARVKEVLEDHKTKLRR